MICEYCDHPEHMHDLLTGLCLIEDCDCIDPEAPAQSIPLQVEEQER